MTKDQIEKANEIAEQMKALETFLDSRRMWCWDMLGLCMPAKRTSNVTFITSYGAIQKIIKCSPRLSEAVAKTMEGELSTLKDELDRIGKEED